MADAKRQAPLSRLASIWRWVAFGLVMVTGPAQADDRDLHLEWEDRCAECHGHAGAFARERLAVADGMLTSDHWGDELEGFLANHHTSPATLEPLIAMLTAQATTPPIFALNCAGCHGTAAELVRTGVDRLDDRLVGATNGSPLDDFLLHHGGLEADEVPLLLEQLTRLHDEIGGG